MLNRLAQWSVLALFAGTHTIASTEVVASASDNGLRPFALQYEVIFRGMTAGNADLELQRESGNRWVYRSRNEARGLFRLAVPGEISQTSIFEWRANRVVPLNYQADEGTKSTARDIRLEFDHSAARIRGTAEDKAVDLPLAEGVQDPLSVQITVMMALAAGQKPESYLLIDKDEIKRYDYRFEGRARLSTPSGEFDTVIWSSSRAGSNRRTRVWYAIDRGFLPLQAERLKGDQVEWSMRLRRIKS